MNNYEKIKAMSIDELAEFLCDLFKKCDSCQYIYDCGNENIQPYNPYKQWLLSETKT